MTLVPRRRLLCHHAQWDNPFARILRGEAPARVVHECETLLTFHDVRPASALHLLIIPKRFIQDASQLKPADAPLVHAMHRRAVLAASSCVDGELVESELALGFHWPPAYSVPWLHLHAIYPRATLRQPWKYTRVDFKSPEWVVERLQRMALEFRPPSERNEW